MTCLWVGTVDGQFRVMHQRRVARDGRRPGRWDDDCRAPRPCEFVDGDRVRGGVSGDVHERVLDRGEGGSGRGPAGRDVRRPDRPRPPARPGHPARQSSPQDVQGKSHHRTPSLPHQAQPHATAAEFQDSTAFKSNAADTSRSVMSCDTLPLAFMVSAWKPGSPAI